MRKYLIAAVLVTAFAGAALALESGQYYVGFDGKTCSMMTSEPTGSMKKMGGPYKTEAEAHQAMAGMKECQG
jgi:hypothetical protein